MIKKAIGRNAVKRLFFVIVLMLVLSSPADAAWNRTQIGGGSMKRYLHDVDGDGRVDSLTVNCWYKNPGGNGSSNWQAIDTGWNETKSNGVYQVGHTNMITLVDAGRAGDINGDGLPDMVVGTYGWDAEKGVPENMRDSIYAAINPGHEGEWDLYYIGKLPATEDGVETLAIGDLNNDGFPDITAGGECKEIRLYVNPGHMTNNWNYHILAKDILDGWYFIIHEWTDIEGTVIDHFNDDDYLDVAITACSPNGICGGTYVLMNPASSTPSGSWDRVTLTESSGLTVTNGKYSCAETIAAGDINGDGWNDVVLADRRPYGTTTPDGDSRLYWFENPQGSGSWTQHEIALLSESGLAGRLPAVADIDSDGDQDVICYRPIDGVTYWYENISNGSSWIGNTIYATGRSVSVECLSAR